LPALQPRLEVPRSRDRGRELDSLAGGQRGAYERRAGAGHMLGQAGVDVARPGSGSNGTDMVVKR
jgi:hypothetical protein